MFPAMQHQNGNLPEVLWSPMMKHPKCSRSPRHPPEKQNREPLNGDRAVNAKACTSPVSKGPTGLLPSSAHHHVQVHCWIIWVLDGPCLLQDCVVLHLWEGLTDSRCSVSTGPGTYILSSQAASIFWWSTQATWTQFPEQSSKGKWKTSHFSDFTW